MAQKVNIRWESSNLFADFSDITKHGYVEDLTILIEDEGEVREEYTINGQTFTLVEESDDEYLFEVSDENVEDWSGWDRTY